MNNQPTPCAALQTELKPETKVRSRVNSEQAAGTRTDDNLAPNSTANGRTRRRRPAGDTFDREFRPEAEA